MAQQTYCLILSYNTAGQFAQNIFHWQFEDAGFGTTKAAAEALQAAWFATRQIQMNTILPAAVTTLSLRGSRVSAPGGFEAFTPLTAGNVGLRAGQISASGVAPCIIHYPTDLNLGRGRTFLPGLNEGDCEDGILSSTYVNVAQTEIGNMFDPLLLTGGGNPTAIFGIWRASVNVFASATNSILSQNVGTQRRRMRPA